MQCPEAAQALGAAFVWYTVSVKCPKCETEMSLENKVDVSHNSKTGQKYDRKVFACKADDVWITSEIPRQRK
jgi:hypothetical protein